ALEALRHHADDGELLAVDTDRAADDAAIAAEALLPLAVAEDADQLRARRPILVGQKAAADERSRAEHGEVVAGDDLAEHLVRVARAARDVQRQPGMRGEAGEGLVPVAQRGVVAW